MSKRIFLKQDNIENSEISICQELDGKSVGNKALKVADVIPRSFEKKDKVALVPAQTLQQAGQSVTENSNNHESSNDLEDDSIDHDSTPKSSDLNNRSVRDAVTPLAHMSYADQLEHKKKSLMQTLKRLVTQAYLFHFPFRHLL